MPDPCTNTTSATADVNPRDSEISGLISRWCGDSEVGDAYENRPGVAPSGTRLGGFVEQCGYDSVVAASEPWQTSDARISPAIHANDAVAVASLDTYGISDEIRYNRRGAVRCPAGREIRLVCSHCGKTKTIWQACEDRFRCKCCRKAWIRDTKRRFMPVIDAMVASGGHIRFMTLTVKNGPSLPDVLKHLERSFRKLKQRTFWKRHVQGAIRVLEVTKGKDGWHVHYHVLFTGSYIPQDELANLWEKITGDSRVVDVRYAGGNVVRELFKYTVKDGNLTQDELNEVASVLHNKPVVVVLGRFYRRQVLPPARPAACEECGSNAWMLEGVLFAQVRNVVRRE